MRIDLVPAAVKALPPSSSRFATFDSGNSDLAAGLEIFNSTYNDLIEYMPYDFMGIVDVAGVLPKRLGSIPARARMLQEVMVLFGESPSGSPVGVVPAPEVKFRARAYPNPFNPGAKIDFTLPCPERVTLKIYDVRGTLVRALLDEGLPAGGHSVFWNGTDSAGRTVASGAYFYSLKAGSHEKMEKMTLVK